MAVGGIFCIENWSSNLASKDTVLPLLQFLEQSGAARVIHQRISVPEELRLYLWRCEERTSYQICYLAMHGDRERVYIGSEPVTLDELVSLADPEGDGATSFSAEGPNPDDTIDFRGKVLYLGSCASLKTTRPRLAELRRRTRCSAVCGYTKSVEWFEAGAFDIMLLSALSNAVGRRRPVSQEIRRLRTRAGSLLDTLGFVCEPDWQP